MKKQKLTTKKLSLNKFKIASISNFGKSKIFGGTDAIGDGDDNLTTLSIFSTAKCKKDNKKELTKLTS